MALLALTAGCGAPDAAPPVQNAAGIGLSFEEIASPDVFRFEGSAMRPGAPGAPGLWAAVPGLPRPERAEAVNLATGARVTLALFSGSGETVARLSDDAAEALGIAPGGRAPVRVTALRREPRLRDPQTGRRAPALDNAF